MHSILIHLNDATFRALNAIAPAAKRLRMEFIRKAIKEAIGKQEFERMREAYLRQPDSASEADDWSNAEEYRA